LAALAPGGQARRTGTPKGGCQPRQHGSIRYDLVWFGFATFLMLNAAGVPPAKAAEHAAEVVAAV